MGSSSDIWRLIQRHRAQVLARDRATLRHLTREWLKIERVLVQQMNPIAEEAVRTAATSGLTPEQLRIRAESLQRQLFARIGEYGETVADITTAEQRRMIELVGSQFESQLAAMGALPSGFNALPVTAMESMVGHVAGGSPIYNYFLSNGLADKTMTAIGDALIKGIALGRNPKVVARLMADAAGLPHRRALLIARSEMMRIMRITSLENYRQSDIVQGWVWLASKSDRTCLACLAKDGSIHPLDEEFNDHPAGRCGAMPYLPGITPKFQTGREWFEQQPTETQMAMMGPRRYAAWRGNRFAFDDLAHPHHSPVFGTHYQEASLEQAIQNAARRRALE